MSTSAISAGTSAALGSLVTAAEQDTTKSVLMLKKALSGDKDMVSTLMQSISTLNGQLDIAA